MNESRTTESQELVNKILDKISEMGYNNLASFEKEILNKASAGESLDDYIDQSGTVTFDNGRILIDDLPYDEWSRRERLGLLDKDKKDKKNKHEWSKTKSNGPEGPDYTINVYKNNGSDILYYYMFFNDSSYKKFTTEKELGSLFKRITLKKSLDNFKSELLSEYDNYKELTIDELNDFETLMYLRIKFKKGIFNNNDLESKKNIELLKKLYNKFSNI